MKHTPRYRQFWLATHARFIMLGALMESEQQSFSDALYQSDKITLTSFFEPCR